MVHINLGIQFKEYSLPFVFDLLLLLFLMRIYIHSLFELVLLESLHLKKYGIHLFVSLKQLMNDQLEMNYL